MKRLLSTVFLLHTLVLSVNAHHVISGLIINAETQAPLAGATIQILNSNAGVISNEFGQFKITVESDEVVLVLSHVGFSEKRIEVSAHDTNLRISLEPSTIELNQLSIVAGGINSINTVSKLDLNLRPVNSSQDVLRIVPGLFIAQHAGGGKAEQIFLRGFDIDHGTDVDITVDGMPVNMVSHAHGQGYADLHFLIPELINVVDFGKGPYYSDRGNFNTAGYVGFTTKNTLPESSVTLEGGRFNTFRALGMFDLLGEQFKLKGHQAIAALEYQSTDGPFEHPQNFNRINLFTKYSGYIGDNLLTVQLSYFDSKWDASGQIPERAVADGSITRFGAIDPTEGGFTGRTNASVRLVSNLPSGIVADNQFFFTSYDFELYSNFTFYLNNPEFGDQIRQKESRSIIGWNGELTRDYETGNARIKGRLGYGFRYDDVNDSELTSTMDRKTDLSAVSLGDIFETNGWLYADATFESDHWVVNGGVRLDAFRFEYVDKLAPAYETQSSSAVKASPKLNVIYLLNDQTQLYVKSGAGFHSNDARVVVAANGEDILPAAYGVDIGSTFKPAPSVFLNIAYWYLFLEQEFVYVGDEGVVEPSGKTKRHGFDVSIRWQVLPWLFADFDVNHAITTAIDEPEGANYIPLAPTWTSVGGLSFEGKSKFSGSIRYRYIKDRPANEDNSITALGYTVLDGRLNFTDRFYTIGLTLENMLNTEWNEAQFATETRLYNEPAPVEDLTFTPGTPIFAKFSATFRF